MSSSSLSDNPFASSDNDLPERDLLDELIFTFFQFDGRIGRGRYWLAYVASMLAAFAVMMPAAYLLPEDGFLLVVVLFLIPGIWAGLAIEIKRWHDLGKSGFWVFVGLIPYVGGLIKLVMLGFLPGDDYTNEYGDPPR